MSPLFLVSFLLATSNREGRRHKDSLLKSRRVREDRDNLGRNRYTRDGIKKKSVDDGSTQRQEGVLPLPDLTIPNGPRPTYFTCRHGYEDTLIDEIKRYASLAGAKCVDRDFVATSPYPGLVRVDNDILPKDYDPTYALQCMPQCVVVSSESIKGIAREVLSALIGDETEGDVDERTRLLRKQLLKAEKGSLIIHPLVPGMCKGQAKPVMQHRSSKIGEELSKILRQTFPAARKTRSDGSDRMQKDPLLLQVMLQSPSIAVASLTKCQCVGPGESAYWPNLRYPLGLAKVDIEERMPSSAYRKLMESVECMGVCPTQTTVVVDLGACPGGWTSVMRRYFDCRVIAVDRSELDPVLMKDPMTTFIKGDAFVYEPPSKDDVDYWMISDVIAYPERTTELLTRWCTNKWASNMVVTMKFQGNEPDFDELNTAVQSVEKLGYHCRVKHFFNNKNEVTFMVSRSDVMPATLALGNMGTPMFSSL